MCWLSIFPMTVENHSCTCFLLSSCFSCLFGFEKHESTVNCLLSTVILIVDSIFIPSLPYIELQRSQPTEISKVVVQKHNLNYCIVHFNSRLTHFQGLVSRTPPQHPIPSSPPSHHTPYLYPQVILVPWVALALAWLNLSRNHPQPLSLVTLASSLLLLPILAWDHLRAISSSSYSKQG